METRQPTLTQRLSDRLQHRSREVMLALVLTLATAAILIATISP
jgi:hypothetical protein